MKARVTIVLAALAVMANGARWTSAKNSNSSTKVALSSLTTTFDRRSLKKGIILPPTSPMQCEDMQLFNNKNYGWWYSWRQAPTSSWDKSDACKEVLEHSRFVPMLKNYIFTEEKQLKDTWMDSPYMLGYNEPYGSHSTKTGVKQMTSQECIDGMKIVVQKAESAPHAMSIIAPTVNPKKSAMTWYRKFHADAVKDGIWSKFKYINVHYYTCDAKKMMKKLHTIYKTFGLPIWLTEFNCDGNTGTATPEQHLAYMQALLPKLEAADYVARYSWYTLRNAKTPNANLAKGVGQREGEGWVGELTALGRWYDEYVPDEGLRNEAHTEHEYDEDEEDAEDDDNRGHQDDDSITDWFTKPAAPAKMKQIDTDAAPAPPVKISKDDVASQYP